MLSTLPDATLAALAGAAGGIALGLAARLGRFCTLGAVEDYLYQNNDTRMRMWLLAIAVASLAVFAMVGAESFDPAQSFHFAAPFSPFAHILGGLLFGYGMALAGNCGFGALARAGGGDLRAFVIVLVMGISAYVMLAGPLAQWRLDAVALTALDIAPGAYPDLMAAVTGLPKSLFGGLFAGLIGALALWSRPFRAEQHAILWALVVGLAVASGWAATYRIAHTGFDGTPVISHTFTAPMGESLLYLMTSSGGGLSFGVGSVTGVLAGAFLGSLIKGHFRWEACEDPRELKRQIAGAVLMGFGAVLALGCTIGQGLSAMALFTYGAPLTLVSIWLGAALGLKQLITGFGPLPGWRE